jgi:hypothetical protein
MSSEVNDFIFHWSIWGEGDSTGVTRQADLPKVRRITYDFSAAHRTRTIVSVDQTLQLVGVSLEMVAANGV